MKTILMGALLVTMSVVLASGADLHKEVLYTQVRVRCDAVGGSGTVIYSEKVGNFFDTYILTCHHVVEGAVKVETKWDSVLKKDRKVEISVPVIVEFFNWGSVPHGQSPLTSGAQASIVAYDQDDDVAILYLKLALRPAVAKTLPRESIEKMLVGRQVYAVGCALLNDPILTSGLLTHMGSIIDSRDYWMSSAAIIFGNSGGAMFTELDGAFYFLGIPSRISVTYGGQAITHLGYFSPISRIYKFMEMQIFDFLVPGSKRTPADCEKERKDKRERAKMMPDIPVEQNSGKAGRHSGFSDDDPQRYDAFRNGG